MLDGSRGGYNCKPFSREQELCLVNGNPFLDRGGVVQYVILLKKENEKKKTKKDNKIKNKRLV